MRLLTSLISSVTLAAIVTSAVAACSSSTGGNAGATPSADIQVGTDGFADDVYTPGPGGGGDGLDGGGVDGAGGVTDNPDAASAGDATDGGGGSDVTDGTPPATRTERVDFGTVESDSKGNTPTLELVLPDDVYSLHFTAVTDPGTMVTIGSLVAPDKQFLVATNWFDSVLNQGAQMCTSCRIRVTSAEAAVGVLVPNTPEYGVKGGRYTFSFHTFTSKSENPFQAPVETPVSRKVTIHALVQRSPLGPPKASKVDLNLHFTGAGGLHANNAAADPEIIKALGKVTSIYAGMNVSIGEVRYRDIDPGMQKIDSLSGAGNDFETIASLTAGADPGVNFIFVDSITDASNPMSAFGVILGIAGGIPGPAGVQGTGRSAVFVSLQKIMSQPGAPAPDGFGQVMAHEAGHYLGLFHSSEMSFGGGQGLHDPIPDTAENDEQNLMFYTGSGTTISPNQGFVVRNNPWVIPVVE